MRKQRLRQNSPLPKDFLDKSLTGGQGDGDARIHGHLDIGQDNRVEP